MAGKDANPISVGKIRLDLPKLAELKTRVMSPIVNIANMPWNICVESECSKRTSNIKHFSVYLNCNEADQSPHWSCEASVIFKLLAPKVGQKPHSHGPLAGAFSTKNNGLGCAAFIEWDKVLDPANGFILEEDGGVVVEAVIIVRKVFGLTVPTLCDFTAPHPNLTDVALIVEGKPLHVSKTYLAYYSPVFHSMFFSKFAEKEKKEIPLEDVKYGEFVELLHFISPSRKPVALATVEGLLRLADRFCMQMVLYSCEEFLRGPDSEEIPIAKKLLWSDQYRLANLQSICLQSLKSVLEVKALKATKEYGDFTDKTKAALVERALKLSGKIAGKADYPIAVGKIRLYVPNLAELETSVESQVVSIADTPWSLVVKPHSVYPANVKYFSAFVRCNFLYYFHRSNPHWSCEASAIIELLSPKVGQKSHRVGPFMRRTYCTKQKSRGYPSFIAQDKALDPENGFIRDEDGGVVFKATITVTKVIGLSEPTLFDFTAPQPNLTDVALIVEGKPVHVSKTYLAYYSPVFHSMFFLNFLEKEKKEIPLEDIKYDEFLELLHVIFPSRKPVAVATVESLLRLADRFSMQVVLKSCEEFLRGPDSQELPLVKKLLWSELYRLASLQSVCVQSFKSVPEVKALTASKEYGDFSGKLKEELAERMLELA